MKALADLNGMDEAAVRNHIAIEYAGEKSGFEYGEPNDEDKAKVAADLERFDILIAYEHVGSWGCDSSSWFLMRERTSGALYEFSGGHCSYYGFEGQYSPEPTSLEYLRSGKFGWYGGGYDDHAEEHRKMIVDEFAKL